VLAGHLKETDSDGIHGKETLQDLICIQPLIHTMTTAKSEDLYSPLDSGKGEIRLLTISTRDLETEQIDVRISTASLPDAGKYFALSYTWGDPKNRREISLNGLPFSVTSNLFEALRSIQTRLSKSELEGHKVWADALCINQTDLEERNEQVARMRDIFAGAEIVWAYIGSDCKQLEPGFNLLLALAEKYKDLNPTFGLPKTTHDEIARFINLIKLKDAWTSIGDIFTRPWWGRAWIIQELAVANSAIFLCGEIAVDCSKVFHAGELLDKYLTTIINNSDDESADKAHAFDQFRGLLEGVNKVASLSLQVRIQRSDKWLESMDHPSLIEVAYNLGIKDARGRPLEWTEVGDYVLHHLHKLPGHTLSSVLARFRDRQCTEPRDKIFAYLGLTRRSKEADVVQVDYNVDLSTLWRQVTRAHVRLYKDLNIFHHFASLHRPKGFSSWAHDMVLSTAVDPLKFEVEELQIIFRASLDLPAQFSFPAGDEERLALKGVTVDVIESVGHKYDPMHPEEDLEAMRDQIESQRNTEDLSQMRFHGFEQKSMKDWKKIAGVEEAFALITEQIFTLQRDEDGDCRLVTAEPAGEEFSKMWNAASAACGGGSYPTGQRKLDAFIQTLMLDPTYHVNYGEVFLQRRHALLKYQRGNPLAPYFTSNGLINLSFYTTSLGYFGLSPATVEVGDKVCVLYGGRMPFLLRPTDDYHLVVGWTYVQGLMSGEAIENPSLGEFRDESFILT